MKRFPWLIFFLFLAACNFPVKKMPTPTPGVDADATAAAFRQTAIAAETFAFPAIVTKTPTPAPTSIPKITDLRVVYVKSGNLWLWDETDSIQLTRSGQDDRPKISDDGQVIAFSRNGELWAVNADGSQERVLASSADLSKLPHSATGKLEVSEFDFAPRSRAIFFNTVITGEGFPDLQFDLAKVDPGAPRVESLLKNGQGGQPVFSPDGGKIALVQPEKISIINADGSGFKTLFKFKLVSTYSEWFYLPEIVWMPDSSGFKTVIPAHAPLENPKELTRLYFIPAAGGEVAKLAEFLAAPVFLAGAYISPDGTKVIYARPEGGNLELHVIDVSTADKLLFWQPRDKFGLLGWTPDSQGVLYWRDDTRRAWLLTPDGESTPLSDVTYAYYVTWVDKSRYLFTNETELRLRSLGQPSLLINAELSGGFDFTLLK